MMMCFTAFCHSIFLRLNPGDRVAVRQGGSRSSIGKTSVVSEKVTMAWYQVAVAGVVDDDLDEAEEV